MGWSRLAIAGGIETLGVPTSRPRQMPYASRRVAGSVSMSKSVPCPGSGQRVHRPEPTGTVFCKVCGNTLAMRTTVINGKLQCSVPEHTRIVYVKPRSKGLQTKRVYRRDQRCRNTMNFIGITSEAKKPPTRGWERVRAQRRFAFPTNYSDCFHASTVRSDRCT
jgi:hypothetical protein